MTPNVGIKTTLSFEFYKREETYSERERENERDKPSNPLEARGQ